MGFAELEQYAKQLNEINKSIADFEQIVGAMNLGIEAWVPIETATHTQMGWKQLRGQKPHLYCRKTLADEQLVLEAPWEVRIATIAAFPLLVEALYGEAVAMIEKIDHATAKFKESTWT